MIPILKLLIANRGEIAVRIIRAARSLNIKTLAIYAPDDAHSLHVKHADESVNIGSGTLADTYLNIDKIIQIAKVNHCDAIHPGYGFLSENEQFARACAEQNIIFVGPSPEVLHLMGNKEQARRIAENLNLPIIRGFSINENNLTDSSKLPFPLILKPSLGGGGKGMITVNSQVELKSAFERASREAGNFFADTAVYAEMYIEKARHIEVQVLGDSFGNIVHLFERECSMQRNFQKIIEEAPAVSISEELRVKLLDAAVNLAKHVNYQSAGTVEFLVDEFENWYFIEMNARIQVEHPVTEEITGVDLVVEQLRIAQEMPVSFNQADLKPNGHAIEVRINSENPENNFSPSAGNIYAFNLPTDCRIETFFNAPYSISPAYDSLLAKIIVHEKDRSKAIKKLRSVLSDTASLGISNNIKFLEYLINSQEYIENKIFTRFCNLLANSFSEERKDLNNNNISLLAGLIFVYLQFIKSNTISLSISNTVSCWKSFIPIPLSVNQNTYSITFERANTGYTFYNQGMPYFVWFSEVSENQLIVNFGPDSYKAFFIILADGSLQLELNRFSYVIESPLVLETALEKVAANEINVLLDNKLISSPLHGRIVKVLAEKGQIIKKGDLLIIIEAMKTENNIFAHVNGFVKDIYVKEGEQVRDNEPLIKIV